MSRGRAAGVVLLVEEVVLQASPRRAAVVSTAPSKHGDVVSCDDTARELKNRAFRIIRRTSESDFLSEDVGDRTRDEEK